MSKPAVETRSETAAAVASDPATVTSLANGIAEAAVLFAVVAVPLYFSVLTGAGYEADKAVLLRLIGAVAAAAWIVGRAAGPSKASAGGSRAMVWLVAALLGVYIVSTVLSIDPRLSVFSSFDRGEGLWTFGALAAVVAVAAGRFRAAGRVDRLVSVILAGSVPATVYGLLQQFGLDPVPASGDPSSLAFPVWSTFGQHLFFASYLVMVIPLTAARVWETREGWRSPAQWAPQDVQAAVYIAGGLALFFVFLLAGVKQTPLFALYPLLLAGLTVLALATHQRAKASTRAQAAAYAALLLAQVVALLFTGARGAWLAFLVSVPVFGILLGRRLNRPMIWQSLTAATVVVGAFLLLLNIPGGPLQPLRTVKGLSRLADITGGAGSEGSAQGRVLIWHGVVKLISTTPPIGNQAGGSFRDVIGYGPESLAWAFQRVFPLQLRQVTDEIWTWDRAHDIFLNYFAELGAAGLAVIVALLILYFVRLGRRLESGSPRPLILIALAGGMAAHLVDGVFGLEMAVTLLFFWLFVGLVAGPAWREEEVPPARLRQLDSVFMALLVGGLAVALLLVVIPQVQTPAVLSALIVLSALAGIGVVALPLMPEGVTLPRLSGRVALSGGVAALAVALSAGAVWQVEHGALADRTSGSAFAAGKTALGIGDLQEAVNADPTEPRFSTDLGNAYLSLAASRAGPGKTVALSADAYRTLAPGMVTVLGRSELFALSRQAMQETLSLTPLDPEAWDSLGLLDRAQRRDAASLSAFRHAETLSLQNPRYLDEEALTLIQAGNTDQAMSVAKAAEALDNGYWYSHYAAAEAAQHAGNRPAAQQEANLALADVPATWPPPPQSEIQALQQMAAGG